jgi:hypothetical protein
MIHIPLRRLALLLPTADRKVSAGCQSLENPGIAATAPRFAVSPVSKRCLNLLRKLTTEPESGTAATLPGPARWRLHKLKIKPSSL